MIEVEIEIQEEGWTRALPNSIALTRQAVLAAGRLVENGGVAILLADDETVRDLNHRFLGKNAATNVLAFPAAPDLGEHLGDVALAFGVCSSEAEAQGKPLGDHLRHLVIHGVLHLLGYDHRTDAQARRMETMERDLLASLDVPDPYAGVGDQGDHVQHGR